MQIQVDNLQVHIPIREGFLRRVTGLIRVVDGISFEVHAGETFVLLGETGNGKTTAVRSLLHLTQPTGGAVWVDDKNLTQARKWEQRQSRQDIQLVLANPYASLNPRLSVGELLQEPLNIHNVGTSADREQIAQNCLQEVGLNPYLLKRYAHQFSGSVRQRIAIARALTVDPQVLILDEPMGELDETIQQPLVDLLWQLKKARNLSLLMSTQQFGRVTDMADYIAVLYAGQIVEMGTREEIEKRPLHPYTQALLSQRKWTDPKQERKRQPIPLKGRPPNPAHYPAGCRFNPRCQYAQTDCYQVEPVLRNIAKHQVACHLAEQFI